jgi:hypothetical protein
MIRMQRLCVAETSSAFAVLLALLFAAAVLGASPTAVRAQSASGGTDWNETWVGSEWEVYTRALADRGLLGASNEPWSSRPFAPSVIRGWRATLDSASHPWSSRLPQRADTGGWRTAFVVLRPSITTSYNSGFPWGLNDGPVWQGRGLNAWGTAGVAFHAGILSVRLEPLVDYAQNQAFQLEPTPAGTSPFANDMEPYYIDVPQRFGPSTFHIVNPGQSYVRLDWRGATVGFSTEDIFWGPGVQQALLFDDNASGFPHVFLGSSHGIATPVGTFYGQLIYGRLEESGYGPASVSASRFGAGGIVVWMAPGLPIEIGAARFYHRAWPKTLDPSELLVPFGSVFQDPEVENMGATDNQLASVFASVRVPSSGFELFGELGKTDRNSSFRDLAEEPEHNSAWLLGFMDVVGPQSLANGFWTVRADAANGRIGALQDIGRTQSTFYDHDLLTQGHTEDGQLLGSPLIERAGGVDASVDRWMKRGRMGVSLFERQMPEDLEVGMPANQLRSQWDVGLNGTLFAGAERDITFAVGRVWDLNRFPGTDVCNNYLRLGVRAGWP